METELKFSPVTAEQAAAVLAERTLWTAQTPPRVLRMEALWYDTADGALARARWTLRLRREDGRGVCTLKGPSSGWSREEYELPAETPEQGAAALSLRPELPEEVRAALGQPLTPVCGARFDRTAVLCASDGVTFELSRDEGVLFCGAREAPLSEIELELKSGDAQALFALGETLAVQQSLTPCRAGKKTRALALGRRDDE